MDKQIKKLDELLNKPILTCKVCNTDYPAPEGRLLRIASPNYSLITPCCSEKHVEEFINCFLVNAKIQGLGKDDFEFSFIERK